MNRAYVEIEVETSRAEAKAILEAMRPESKYGPSPFRISLTDDGMILRITGRSLSDARAITNSVLRLLKAARESIQAVD